MITVYKMNGEKPVPQGLRRSVAGDLPIARPDLPEWGEITKGTFAPGLHLPPYAEPHFSSRYGGEFVGSGSDRQQLRAGHGPAQAGRKHAAGRVGIWMTLTAPGTPGLSSPTQGRHR